MLSRTTFKLGALSLSFLLPVQADMQMQAKGDYIQFKLLGKMVNENLWPAPLQQALQSTGHNLEELQASILTKGEEYFAATLYSESIPCYLQLLELITYELLPFNENIAEFETFLLCRLGRAYFYKEQYTKAALYLSRAQQYFDELSPHIRHLKHESLLFLALSYRQNHQYQQAIASLQTYKNSEKLPLVAKDIKLELALNYFLLHKVKQAAKIFKKISIPSEGAHAYTTARLYLTRIYLATKMYQKAAQNIATLEELQLDNQQKQQLSFLQGERAYLTKDYNLAIACFKKALENTKKHSLYYQESLYRLAWSWLKLAKYQSVESCLKLKLFEKAEKAFVKLIKTAPSEGNYLALAQALLIKAKFQRQDNDSAAKERQSALATAQKILACPAYFSSTEAKAKALLLQAQAAFSLEEKEHYLAALLEDEFCHTRAYLYGLFESGLMHYQRGEQYIQKSPGYKSLAYEMAAGFFEKCFLNSYINYPKLAIQTLKWQVYALYKDSSLSALLKAFESLENNSRLLHSSQSTRHVEAEMHYLQGMIAVKLATFSGHDQFQQRAKTIFSNNIQNQLSRAFTDLNLFALASLYMHQNKNEKALNLFLQIIDEFPTSSCRSSALHCYIQVAEKLKQSNESLAKYRRELFEKYSHSPFAALAYFHYFSYKDYMQGEENALDHLQKMEAKFPDSPLLINCHYLIGLDHRHARKADINSAKKAQLLAAISAFRAAEITFERLYTQNAIAKSELPYYALMRCKALLERAYSNQALAEISKKPRGTIFLHYAKDLLRKINTELNDKNNPLSSLVAAGEGLLPPIQEEALYAELQLDIAASRQNIEKTIESILQKYKQASITKGYYLSRIYYELGQIKMAKKEYDTACSAYMQAEECEAGKFLSVDQRLDLWIKQSLCHTHMELMDKAMLILSRVINHKAVSSLRVQAMYLRAHLYKLQGRHDLARKQLEATSKKGGEWAAQAKLALEKDYH